MVIPAGRRSEDAVLQAFDGPNSVADGHRTGNGAARPARLSGASSCAPPAREGRCGRFSQDPLLHPASAVKDI
jgi:hypothetical protein